MLTFHMYIRTYKHSYIHRYMYTNLSVHICMNWQPLLPKNPAGHLPQPPCDVWTVEGMAFFVWTVLQLEDDETWRFPSYISAKTRGQSAFVHPKDTLLKWSSWEIFPSKTTLPVTNNIPPNGKLSKITDSKVPKGRGKVIVPRRVWRIVACEALPK